MEAKELYINGYYNHNGNWNYKDYKGVFQFIESDWYAIGECILDLNDIKPIPLTEEWLLKIPEMVNKYGRTYFVNKLKFDINNDNKIRFHFSGKVIYVDYLHQIQNIVFVLTNKELEINLNN